MKKYLLLSSLLVLTGCSHSIKSNKIATQAVELQPEIITKTIEKPVVRPLFGQLQAIEELAAPVDKKIKTTGDLLEDGNAKARQKPEEARFFNSITQYDYMDGALYQVYCAPLKLTIIMLEAGEKISGQVLIGDSATWVAKVETTGDGENIRQLIYLKPLMANRKTTLSIPTNKRVYAIELTAFKNSYMSQVKWNYFDDLIIKAKDTNSNIKMQLALDPEALNFNYKVKKIRGKPSWKPTAVFDDGAKTYIRFSPAVNHGELPILFLISKESNTQLVNYRYQDNVMIIDRLFEQAELRLGKKHPQIIRIKRLA